MASRRALWLASLRRQCPKQKQQRPPGVSTDPSDKVQKWLTSTRFSDASSVNNGHDQISNDNQPVEINDEREQKDKARRKLVFQEEQPNKKIKLSEPSKMLSSQDTSTSTEHAIIEKTPVPIMPRSVVCPVPLPRTKHRPATVVQTPTNDEDEGCGVPLPAPRQRQLFPPTPAPRNLETHPAITPPTTAPEKRQLFSPTPAPRNLETPPAVTPPTTAPEKRQPFSPTPAPRNLTTPSPAPTRNSEFILNNISVVPENCNTDETITMIMVDSEKNVVVNHDFELQELNFTNEETAPIDHNGNGMVVAPEDIIVLENEFDELIVQENVQDETIESATSGMSNADDSVQTPIKPRRKRRAAPPESPNATPKRRKLNSTRWKDALAKEARSKGLAYVSKKGKQVLGKELLPGCSEHCRLKCHTKVSLEERQRIFRSYYSTSDHTQKWNFISRCVSVSPVKRRTTDEDLSKRHNTLTYFIHLSDKSKVKVCRKFFLDTIATSVQVLKTAVVVKQKNNKAFISPDKRGKKKRKEGTGAIIRNNVKAHIASFKPVESHYCRKTSKCTYLPQTLNVRKMHSLYLMARDKNQPHTANLRQYRDVFNQEFYIKFVKPKKDMCSLCLNWNNKSAAEKENAEALEIFNLHIQNKKKGHELKVADSLRPKTEPNVCVISMDFQQILESPKGSNSEYYYKSKLKCYNFSIFEHHTKQGICFVWDQTIAAKGATEVSSCVFKLIEELSQRGVEELVIWSDNCWSQNKNRLLFSLYNMASIKFNMKFTHRFLEKGHTHMEVDSMHALIERSSKGVEVYTPSQWYAIMKAAKKNDPRYRVVEMEQKDFKDFREVSNLHNWSQVKITQIREIEVHKNEVQVKYNYGEEARTFSILKMQVGRPVRWETFRLNQAYHQKFIIPKNALDDIKWYVEKGHIPTSSVPYYESLFQVQAELNDAVNNLNATDSGDECDSCNDEPGSEGENEGED